MQTGNRIRGQRGRFSLIAALATLGWGAAPALATLVVLSDFTSNEAHIPAAAMDANVDFSVSGNVLTVEAHNLTGATSQLNLGRIYFTASDDIASIEGLTTPITGMGPQSAAPSGIEHSVEGNAAGTWVLFTSNFDGGTAPDSVAQCAGFGVFDYAIKFDTNFNKKFQAGPGETVTFTLAFTCAGGATCDMADFGTELSIGPGPILSLVCAKFIGVDEGDYKNLSAFGASDDYVGGELAPGPEPFCGDEICDAGEDQCSCWADCGLPPADELNCADGIDDDCDGMMDCDDPACSTDLACFDSPAPICREVGAFCDSDADCCKNKCRGPEGRMSCKDGK